MISEWWLCVPIKWSGSHMLTLCSQVPHQYHSRQACVGWPLASSTGPQISCALHTPTPGDLAPVSLPGKPAQPSSSCPCHTHNPRPLFACLFSAQHFLLPSAMCSVTFCHLPLKWVSVHFASHWILSAYSRCSINIWWTSNAKYPVWTKHPTHFSLWESQWAHLHTFPDAGTLHPHSRLAWEYQCARQYRRTRRSSSLVTTTPACFSCMLLLDLYQSQ